MNPERHSPSLADHESKPHPLPAKGILPSTVAAFGGNPATSPDSGIIFQPIVVGFRRTVAAIWSTVVAVRFTAAPFRNTVVAVRDTVFDFRFTVAALRLIAAVIRAIVVTMPSFGLSLIRFKAPIASSF